ncbi:hypothetical protein Dda_3473 [Drechslerella dactyloides]|uniref:Uncharacterized protein n=1 Tax=Drechslerella dactyloides TaxID=74499 RepID=A0AAD6NKD6_DREDA|nr:hypothetical protein Dda_3473 [Drechslerella dactyloides]
MDSRSSLPTPSASPTSQVPPSRTTQLLFDLLFKLTLDASVRPTFPDPLNDRFRGILYPAVCHRITYHAGPLSRLDSRRIFEAAQTATDLVGYLYPFHAFDLQVDLCTKIVLFGLLLPRNNDIVGLPELKNILIDSSPTRIAEVGELVTELELRKDVGDSMLGVFGLWPLFLIVPVARTGSERTNDGRYYGLISTATTRITIEDRVIRSIINSGVSRSTTGHSDPKRTADFLKECDISKLLASWTFPVYQFDEERYGPVYFPMLDKLVDFTEAITTIATGICNDSGWRLVLDSNAPLSLQSAIQKAASCYKTVEETFRRHPRLWKFAEAYMKGYVCATVCTGDGFKHLFDGEWKSSLEAEWKSRREMATACDEGLSATGGKQCSQQASAEEMEVEDSTSWIKSTVEEYNDWEFLR